MELFLEVLPAQNPTEDRSRVDQLLLVELRKTRPALTRGRLTHAFAEGLIRSGTSTLRASDSLPPGRHSIECLNPGAWLDLENQAAAQAMESFLAVVYEDSEILVLHKESGVPSVPHDGQENHTAVGSALAHCPGLREVTGRSSLEPGLIHRLDTGTSGLLVFAKTPREFERLVQSWKLREIRKIYRAQVATPQSPAQFPAKTPVTWNQPLAHSSKSSKRMLVIDPTVRRTRDSEIRGKPLPALTHLRKVREGGDFEIEIETGVMHQIRAHLAHAGFPIRGDDIYGGEKSSRLWLHAWRLELPLASGIRLQLQAMLPW